MKTTNAPGRGLHLLQQKVVWNIQSFLPADQIVKVKSPPKASVPKSKVVRCHRKTRSVPISELVTAHRQQPVIEVSNPYETRVRRPKSS